MKTISFIPAAKYPFIGSPSILSVHDSVCEQTGLVVSCVLPCEFTGMELASCWASYWILKNSIDSEKFNAQFR